MDLSWTPEEAAFAGEVREWLAANLELPPAFAGFDEEVAWGRRWQAKLAAGRWVGLSWPAEYGGRGASPVQVAIFNAEYARAHGHPDVVVHPLLVLCTAVGLSVEDLSEAGGPFLGINQVEFLRPVYPGDTVTARSTVLSARASESRPAFGIVTWRTEGQNQRGEVVVRYERTNLVARRGAR